MKRTDDLDKLRRRVPIPAVFERGAWVAAPLSVRTSDIGPSQTQLLLWLPVDGDGDGEPTWADIDDVLGPRGADAARSISAEAASALLPEPIARALAADGPHRIVAGAEYPASALESVFWRHGWVIALPTGLVASLVNG